MAYQVPTAPPTDITAADSIEFDWSLPAYPASDGWQLSLQFRTEGGAGATGDLNAAWADTVTADGDTFKVRVPAASTANLIQGPYRLTARVANSTEGVTKSWLVGRVMCHANPVTAVGAKSHARTMRDALRTAIETAASGVSKVAVTVNGRTVQYAHEEARSQLAHYEYLVALEENPDRELAVGVEFVRG